MPISALESVRVENRTWQISGSLTKQDIQGISPIESHLNGNDVPEPDPEVVPHDPVHADLLVRERLVR
jgi:hypothetical protein